MEKGSHHAAGQLLTTSQSQQQEVEQRGVHECALLRFTTADFVSYSTPHVALRLDPCSGTPTIKSIARNPAGLYVMFYALGGLGTYTSHDAVRTL